MTFERRRVVREEVQKWFDEPVFYGFDFYQRLQECFQKKIPFVFVDHAYFDRGYEARNFRIIRGDIHQRKLKPVDRPKTFPMRLRPWQKGSDILIFPPSYTIDKTFNAGNWTKDCIAAIRKVSDRKIVVKQKDDGPLKQFLLSAHCALGYGTVASVEAALWGVPVFCGPRDPTTPIAESDLSRIEEPRTPDREAWFNTLTWSQFHMDEIKSGFAREVINGLG